MDGITDDDPGFARLKARTARLARASITVGIHEADTRREGQEAGQRDAAGKFKAIEGLTNAQIGTKHEFGIGVPQRSFLRAGIDELQDRIEARMEEAIVIAISDQDPMPFVEKLGVGVVGELQARMAKGIDPPLSPYTIEQRRKRAAGTLKRGPANKQFGDRETPLIDTGQLRASITSVVSERGGDS